MRRTVVAVAAAAGFLAVIMAANWVTSHWGLVPVGFGLQATAGTWLAGVSFILRDSIQDLWGRWPVLALIVAGALLSYATGSTGRIALASGIAFLFSETADLLVYTPLRRRGYLPAAAASNVVGAFVDTVVFLSVAGFPVWSLVPGQMVGKLTITLLTVAVVGGVRLVLLRQPQHS